MKQPPIPAIAVTVPLAQKIAAYLVQRPYIEVAELIDGLRAAPAVPQASRRTEPKPAP